MPDKMPHKMPDEFSKNMSDSMPCDRRGWQGLRIIGVNVRRANNLKITMITSIFFWGGGLPTVCPTRNVFGTCFFLSGFLNEFI